MKLFSNTFLKQSFDNSYSAWYYDHKLYPLLQDGDGKEGFETHGKWLSDHADEFDLNIPELEWNDDGSDNWKLALKSAFRKGFIRIQKFNDMTTISVYDFSPRSINLIFQLINDYHDYIGNSKYIEVMTLEYEDYQHNDNFYFPQEGNYVCAESIKEFMEKLG